MEFRHRSDPRRLVDKRPKISRALPVRPCSAQRSLSRRRNAAMRIIQLVSAMRNPPIATPTVPKLGRSVAESAPEATAYGLVLSIAHGLMRIPWDPDQPKDLPGVGSGQNVEASHLANSATGKYRDLLPGTDPSKVSPSCQPVDPIAGSVAAWVKKRALNRI